MPPVKGHNPVVTAICDALGLKYVKRLHLDIEVNKVVTVVAEFYPEKDGIMQLPTILKKFELREVETDDIKEGENHDADAISGTNADCMQG